MLKCAGWIVAAGSATAVVWGLHEAAVFQGTALWLGYEIGYALVTSMMLLALARCREAWHPALRRMLDLLAGAGLAGLEATLAGLSGEPAQRAFFSALLGAALVLVAGRFFFPARSP